MSLRARYEQLASERIAYLDRARECSKLTIPTLFPPDATGQATRLPTPWQSHGARCVNNLAARLLVTLFPPNAPCFRLQVDDFALQQLTGDPAGTARADVEKALNKIERATQTEIESTAMRPSLFEGLKQLIVGGNAGLYVTPANKLRVFKLSNYVTKRDPMGNMLEAVTKECISPLELPLAVRALVNKQKEYKPPSGEDTIEVYTGFILKDTGWAIHQEIGDGDIVIPGSGGFAPKDKCPFMALRWNSISGEDYGRGIVEEYLGDFKSLEGLQKAIVQGSAAAAKVLFLVNPSGSTKIASIAKSESGDCIQGHEEDVHCLQMEKYGDFRIALDTRGEIIKALSFAFMLNAAVQRSGERVTAEEIRFMAQELEETLGGVYSTLSQDLQLPLITVLMTHMERQGRLPALPKGLVRPTITTGIEGIGRGNDTARLQGLAQDLAIFGPDAAAEYLNIGNYATRAGTARGIAMEGLVRTEEEVMQRRAQQSMSAAAERAAPQIVKSGAEMAQGASPNG